MPFTSGSSERTLARIACSWRGRQLGQHLARVGADRHRLRADRDLHAVLREVVERVDRRSPPAPRARARWWRTRPACSSRPSRTARRAAWCWPRRTRPASRPGGSAPPARRSRRTRGARSASANLGLQAVSASVIEEAADTTRRGLLCRRAAVVVVVAAARERQREQRGQRRAARLTALHHHRRRLHRRRRRHAGASPSSSTASRVTAAVTRCGPASISTSAITPSTSTERTTPGKRLRADSASPARWRAGCARRRSISRARHAPPVGARRAWCAACRRAPSAAACRRSRRARGRRRPAAGPVSRGHVPKHCIGSGCERQAPALVDAPCRGGRTGRARARSASRRSSCSSTSSSSSR